MKFKVYLTKEDNYLFFLKCLVNFNIKDTRSYKKEWLKIIGPFSEKDKKLIKEFSKVVRAYRFRISSFNELFSDLLKKQKKEILGENHLKIIKKIYKKFYRRYNNKYWKKIAKVAAKTKKKFSALLKNFSYKQEIIEVLEHFYKAEIANKTIKVVLFLLPDSVEATAGTFSYKQNAIFLEGKAKKLASKRALAILFHELMHLSLQNHYLTPLINECLARLKISQRQKITLIYQIKEVIAWSLLPDGCLAIRYFQEAKPLYIKAKIPRVAKKIMPEVKKYIENKKSIDKKLIEKIIRLLY